MTDKEYVDRLTKNILRVVKREVGVLLEASDQYVLAHKIARLVFKQEISPNFVVTPLFPFGKIDEYIERL